MSDIQISEETLEFFLSKIDARIDKKLEKLKQDRHYYGRINSVTYDTDGVKILNAVVHILENDLDITVKNNTSEILAAGDTVRVTAINGNLANSYISLKCG